MKLTKEKGRYNCPGCKKVTEGYKFKGSRVWLCDECNRAYGIDYIVTDIKKNGKNQEL